MKLNEKQLIRVIYSSWDFQQALSALTFLFDECDFDESYSKIELRRFRCYETTLIMSVARPFEASRNGTTLNLRATGIHLNSGDKQLIDKLMHLRRKIVAHSDEEEMHFRSSTFPVFDGEVNFPHIQFDESLLLDYSTLTEIESLIRRLIQMLAKFLFQLAQDQPTLLQNYKIPVSFKVGETDA